MVTVLSRNPSKSAGMHMKHRLAAAGSASRGGLMKKPHAKGGSKKHISFINGGNKVRIVHVPPRSMNRDFWFTEKEKMVLKTLVFEIEPDVQTSMAITSQVQLLSIVAVAPDDKAAKSSTAADSKARSYLEVKDEEPLRFYEDELNRWFTVASATTSIAEKIQMTLPAGTYLLKATGPLPLLVFAKVIELERTLE